MKQTVSCNEASSFFDLFYALRKARPYVKLNIAANNGKYNRKAGGILWNI